MRYKILRWLTFKVFKTPKNQVPNKFVRLVHFLLFPLHFLYERNSQVHFDQVSMIYTIRGVKISAAFFDMIRSKEHDGSAFIFFKDQFGVTTIERINNF